MFAKFVSVATLLLTGTVAFGDEIVLSSGEVLKVTNVTTSPGKVDFDHPILGHISVASEKVVRIRSDAEVAAANAGLPAPPGEVVVPKIAPEAPALPPAPAPEAPRWKTKAELGVNGTSGNTRSTDLRAAIGTMKETETSRWVFKGVYLKSRTEGETTVANWFVSGLHDWLFKDSPWLLFAAAKYDWDKFKEYDKRVQVGGGVGYRLIDNERTKLRLRAGLNYTREYGAEDDAWRPEGILAAEGSHKINEEQTISGGIIYYPDLKDFWEHRTVIQAEWTMKLSDKGLALAIGATEEIDSHRHDPEKTEDLKYYIALIYEF
jgi:hypothetical protein